MTRLNEVLRLADEQGIGFVPGYVLAAIWEISSNATVDRKDPQAIKVHNKGILAALDAISAWRGDASDGKVKEKREFINMATLGDSFGVAVSAAPPEVFPGEEGHTHPTVLTSRRTGLLRQKKAPRYDNGGHVT